MSTILKNAKDRDDLPLPVRPQIPTCKRKQDVTYLYREAVNHTCSPSGKAGLDWPTGEKKGPSQWPVADTREKNKRAWQAHSSFPPLSIVRTCPRNIFETSSFWPGFLWHYVLKHEIFLHFHSVPVWCSSNLIWAPRLTLCKGSGLGKKWDSWKEFPAKNKMSSVQISWSVPRDLSEDHQCT